MSQRFFVAGGTLILALAGLACTHGYELSRESPRSSQAARVFGSADHAADAPADPGARARSGGSPATPALEAMNAARKLVRTGSIRLEVGKPDVVSRNVAAIAERHGGYVAGMQGERNAAGHHSATITIRVDPPSFMKALDDLRELGTVTAESVTTQDVGKAYADLESRLRTKQAAAARMRQIMDSRTGSLDDVISAELQLGGILEQIEQLEGERRYFDAQVDLSTIAVSLVEPDAPMVVASQPIAFWPPLSEAFHSGRRHFVNVLAMVIYLATVTGPWLVIATLGWMLTRRLRQRTA